LIRKSCEKAKEKEMKTKKQKGSTEGVKKGDPDGALLQRPVNGEKRRNAGPGEEQDGGRWQLATHTLRKSSNKYEICS